MYCKSCLKKAEKENEKKRDFRCLLIVKSPKHFFRYNLC